MSYGSFSPLKAFSIGESPSQHIDFKTILVKDDLFNCVAGLAGNDHMIRSLLSPPLVLTATVITPHIFVFLWLVVYLWLVVFLWLLKPYFSFLVIWYHHCCHSPCTIKQLQFHWLLGVSRHSHQHLSQFCDIRWWNWDRVKLSYQSEEWGNNRCFGYNLAFFSV